MSRHFEEGAGREYVDPQDRSCDICGRVTYSGRLYQHANRFLCAACAVRESKEPQCSYCDAPTFGDYRRVGQTVACGVCTDKWESRYEEEVAVES